MKQTISPAVAAVIIAVVVAVIAVAGYKVFFGRGGGGDTKLSGISSDQRGQMSPGAMKPANAMPSAGLSSGGARPPSTFQGGMPQPGSGGPSPMSGGR